MGKRLFDIAGSSIALLALFPLLAVLGVLIKLDSPGPCVYRSARIGRFRKEFRMYKLRSMFVNTDNTGVFTTPADDPRITRVGKFIRHYNLDELPQFINVLKGDMSLVGPRPEIPHYVAMLTDEEARVILSLRPGITDRATLHIRDKGKLVAGKDDPEREYMANIRPEKLRLQQEYVREHGFFSDVIILLRTFKVHLIDRIFNSPAYSAHKSKMETEPEGEPGSGPSSAPVGHDNS